MRLNAAEAFLIMAKVEITENLSRIISLQNCLQPSTRYALPRSTDTRRALDEKTHSLNEVSLASIGSR